MALYYFLLLIMTSVVSGYPEHPLHKTDFSTLVQVSPHLLFPFLGSEQQLQGYFSLRPSALHYSGR